eukprot:EG_transcript_59
MMDALLPGGLAADPAAATPPRPPGAEYLFPGEGYPSDSPQLSRISEHDGSPAHYDPDATSTTPSSRPHNVPALADPWRRLDHLTQQLETERERRHAETDAMRQQLENRQQQIAALQQQLAGLRAPFGTPLKGTYAAAPGTATPPPPDRAPSGAGGAAEFQRLCQSLHAPATAAGQEDVLQALYRLFKMRDETCHQLTAKVMELSDELQASYTQLQAQGEELGQLHAQLATSQALLQHLQTHAGLRDEALAGLAGDDIEVTEEHYVRTVRTEHTTVDPWDRAGLSYVPDDPMGPLSAELTDLRRRLEASERSERDWQERERQYRQVVAELEARLEALPRESLGDGFALGRPSDAGTEPRLSMTPFETTLQERDVELVALRERDRGRQAELQSLAQQLQSVRSGDERSRTTSLSLMTEVARLQGALDAEQDKADALSQQVNCLLELLQRAKENAAEQTAAAKKGEAAAKDEMRRAAEQLQARIHALQQQLAVREETCAQQEAALAALGREAKRFEAEARQCRAALAEATASDQRRQSEGARLRQTATDAAVRADAERERGEALLRQAERATSALNDLQARAEVQEAALQRRNVALLAGQEESSRAGIELDAEAERHRLAARLARAFQKSLLAAERAVQQRTAEGRAAAEALAEAEARAARLEQQLSHYQLRLLNASDLSAQDSDAEALQQRLATALADVRQLTGQCEALERQCEAAQRQRGQAVEELRAAKATVEQQASEKEELAHDVARLQGQLEAAQEDLGRLAGLELLLRGKEVELSQARRREQQAAAEAAELRGRLQEATGQEEERRLAHRAELLRLQGLVEEAQRQTGELQQEVDRLGEELRAANTQTDAQTAAATRDLEARLASQEAAHRAALREQRTAADEREAELQALLALCQDRLAAQQTTVTEQDAALRSAEEEKARLGGTVAGLQERTATLAQEAEDAATRTRGLEAALAALRARAEQEREAAEAERSGLADRLAAAERQAAEAETQEREGEQRSAQLSAALRAAAAQAEALQAEADALQRAAAEREARLREAAVRLSAQEALLAERQAQIHTTELQLVQIRTLHHETQTSVSRLDFDLVDARREITALQELVEQLRLKAGEAEEHARELARLRTLAECHEVEIDRLEAVEQAGRRTTMALSQLQGAHREQLEALEAAQRQLILDEEQMEWVAEERRDGAQRLAAAQGQLEAAKATRAALEGQLARVTELVQAERRAFAERLAEEVAQTEARLAEALAGEQRLKETVAELTVRLQAAEEAAVQRQRETAELAEELERQRAFGRRQEEALAGLQAQLYEAEDQARRDHERLTEEGRRQQQALETAQVGLELVTARLALSEQQCATKEAEAEEARRAAEEAARRLAALAAQLQRQAVLEEELAQAEAALQRAEEQQGRRDSQLRELTAQLSATAARLSQRDWQAAEGLQELEQAVREGLAHQVAASAGALRLELLAGRLRAAEAALQTAAQRLAEAQRQAEDAESHLAAREEELRRAQATAALAEKRGYEVSRLQGLLQGKEEQLRRMLPLEAELTAKEAALADLEETVADLEPRTRRAAEEAANLKGKLTASETRIAQLADELKRKDADLRSALAAARAQTEATTQEADQRHGALRREHEATVAELTARLEAAQQAAAEEAESRASLSSQLQHYTTLAEQLGREVGDRVAQLRQEQRQRAEAEAAAVAAAAQSGAVVAELRAQLDATSQQLALARQEAAAGRQEQTGVAAAAEQRAAALQEALRGQLAGAAEKVVRLEAAERAAVAVADELRAELEAVNVSLQQKAAQVLRLEEAQAALGEQLAANRCETAAAAVRAEDLQRQLVGVREELKVREQTYVTEIHTLTAREDHTASLVPQLQSQLKALREQLRAAEGRAVEAARLAGVLQAKEQLLGRLRGVEDRLHETELELAKARQRQAEQASRLQRAEQRAEELQRTEEEREEENRRLTTEVARLQAGLNAQKALVAMLRQQLESLTRLLEDDLAAQPRAPGAPVPPPEARARSTINDLQTSLTEQLSQQLRSTEAAYQEQGRQLEQVRREAAELRVALATATHDVALSRTEGAELRQAALRQAEEVRRLEGALAEAHRALAELHSSVDLLTLQRRASPTDSPAAADPSASPGAATTRAQAAAHLAGVLETQRQDFRRQWDHQGQVDWVKVHAREVEMERQLEETRVELDARRERHADLERQLQDAVQRGTAWEAAADAERDRADALQAHLDRVLPRLGGAGPAPLPPPSPSASPSPASHGGREATSIQQQVTVQTVRRVYQYAGAGQPRLLPPTASPRGPSPDWVLMDGERSIAPTERDLAEKEQELQRLEAEMEVVRAFDTRRQEQICVLAQEVSRLRPYAPVGSATPADALPEVRALAAELQHRTAALDDLRADLRCVADQRRLLLEEEALRQALTVHLYEDLLHALAAMPTARPRVGPLGLALQSTPSGLAVTRVQRPSVAQKAGLEEGDVITACAGHPVREAAQLVNLLRGPQGATLSVLRDGRQREVHVAGP